MPEPRPPSFSSLSRPARARRIRKIRPAPAFASLLAGALAIPSVAAADNPQIPALKVAVPPKIDGDLSDDAWKGAPFATGFVRQTHPPAEPTLAWAAYDDKNLYFAFRCLDSQPGQIHRQQKKRDGGMDSDDSIIVGIDPQADKRNLYWFQANPLGTQSEEIPGGSASKVEWRGDWIAAAKVDEKGWTAEMAIPFSILKYPSGQTKFGIIFRRNLARIGEESDWPSGADYYNHETEAFLDGVAAPRQRVVPRYMPYVLMGAGGNLKNSAGIDIKYTAPNNVTGLMTIRPDFQTIEDDIQTIDFSYNPRFIDDHRPFFTEGGDRFNDGMMFYSRNIGEIDGGLKAFGKVGRLGFGAMEAFKFGGDDAAIANVSYDATPHSDAGMELLNYDGASTNRTAKFWANGQKPMPVGGYYWGGSVYRNDGSDKSATAVTAYIDRWAGWGIPGWHVYYNSIPANYDPALGFVYEKDKRSVDGWTDYGKEYKTGKLLNWSGELDYRYAEHFDGSLFYKGITPNLYATFRNDRSVHVWYDLNDRPPNEDRVLSFDLGFKIRDIYRSAHLSARSGRLDGGRYQFVSLSQGFKLSDRLSWSLSAERLSMNYPDDREDLRVTQGTISGVYDLTSERGIVFRLVGNDQGGNAYAAYRQELRKGADAFLILGDPNAATFQKRIGLKITNAY